MSLMSDRLRVPTFDLLPRYFRETDVYGYLKKFSLSFDDEIAKWNLALDEFTTLLRIDTAPDSQVEILAYNLGLSLPKFFDRSNARRFIKQLPYLLRRKQDLNVIRDAIRILLNMSATILIDWNNSNNWEIGVSEIGGTQYIGPNYLPRFYAFEVGVSEIGDKSIGDDGVNLRIPRTFTVSLTREPTATEMQCLLWICKYFKSAEEHFILYWPNSLTYWKLDFSRLGIDTTLAPSYWEIGVSSVGITNVIGGPSVTYPDPIIFDPEPVPEIPFAFVVVPPMMFPLFF